MLHYTIAFALISASSATHGYLRNYVPQPPIQPVQTFSIIPDSWRYIHLCEGICEKFVSDAGWTVEQTCEKVCDKFIFWRMKDVEEEQRKERDLETTTSAPTDSESTTTSFTSDPADPESTTTSVDTDSTA